MICTGTTERNNEVKLAIYRKMLIFVREVLNVVISCPLIRNNSSIREDILPDKRHKRSSIPLLNCNNKALITPSLDAFKTLLMWDKLSSIKFSAGQNRLIDLNNFAWSA